MKKFIVILDIFEDELKTKFLKSGHILIEAKDPFDANKKLKEKYPYTKNEYIGQITEEF